ncbi:hypothetical protein KKF81_06270 [Candidatus Micrarchaeota archaeon]|nr:hypothetical protein [Candidatus Micrarchaeota archaeon]MBU1166535.1 hypothetical protein [Candidatus Micrarchaeota archaeon]MBU1887547.1 hypothetical protein [Candidatus Micrarchaeota archaeon]
MDSKLLFILLCFIFFVGCVGNNPIPSDADSPAIDTPIVPFSVDRESKIPLNAVKMLPADDFYPPQLHSDQWEEPEPLSYPINTRGAEDSPFVMPDGNTIYVWFTPNNRMDISEQVQDEVTGIYKFGKQEDGSWSDAERIWLVEPGKPHLDGCGFFQDNKVWICGAREGYTGLHWFTSEFSNGKWSIAEISDFNPDYEVGELHISNDGNELYYHSPRAGGKGGYDLWMSKKMDGEWQEPTKLEILNTEQTEGWPYLSQDGSELWFTRVYMGSPAIYRSIRGTDDEWQEPELILSQFAGEPTLDNDGNIYFTHHFYENGTMIEADIYVAMKK